MSRPHEWKREQALHNRERFYLATLQASLQYPIRRVATARSALPAVHSAWPPPLAPGSARNRASLTLLGNTPPRHPLPSTLVQVPARPARYGLAMCALLAITSLSY